MADFDDLYGSRFLAATDLKGPVNTTIDRVEEETFSRDGRPRTKKVLFCKGANKGIVLNKVNAGTLAATLGKRFEEWPGKRIRVQPENTTFNGKVVAAIRLYPVAERPELPPPPESPEPPPKPKPKPAASDDLNDSMPW